MRDDRSCIPHMELNQLLIGEIFQRSLLWDHRLKDYHNRNVVDHEWDNVARALNITSIVSAVFQ